MNKTNIHDINQDTSKSQKKTTSRKGITTGIMLTAGVLATNLSEGQNTHISTQQKKDTNEYTLIQNDTIQQNNDTVSFGPDNDTLDYRTYFDYPIKRVIDEFGEEKALEIIQYNLLLEINDSRKEMGVNPLILDKNLIKASQSYTKEMAKNKRLSHT